MCFCVILAQNIFWSPFCPFEDMFAVEILCPGFSIFCTLLITRLEFEERRGFGNAERMWGLAK